jgi:uncharacterized protein (TIGR02391 family)
MPMSPSKNRRVVKIPRHDKIGRIIERQIRNSHILENLVFPSYQDESLYDVIKRLVETFEQAGIAKRLIYAFIKTERLLSKENVKFVSSEEKKEWNEAIREYERLVASGVLQRSDSLVPFIIASKEIPNPRKSKAELERVFDSRNFHREVVMASRTRFINYDFPNSVFCAYKNLMVSVQEMSGNFGDDGIKLITSVFSSKNPVLQSGLARVSEDTSIQDGIMYLFMGAVLCVRNVFAHKEIYLTNIDQTLDYLSFSSFLFRILDVMELVDMTKRKKLERHNPGNPC